MVPLRSVALPLVLLLVACGGESVEEAAAASEASAAVTANLLDSRVDRGVGAAVPYAGPQPPSGIAAPRQEIDLALLGFNVGDTAAPIQIVEFSDFGCSYCRQFHLETYPVLEEEYMATGKVEWKYVPMILGMFPNAVEAAEVGECAGEQERFAEMRDRLFEDQSEWKNADDPWPVLYGFAEEMGYDMAQLRSCISEGRRRDRIAAGSALAQEVGVRGTPTFFVMGYQPIPGVIPLDLFRQVLDTVYAEATANGG